MTEESPTLETPQETPATEETPEQDVDALLSTLEAAGIGDEKSLQGKLDASRQAGNLANQLGDARAEIARLTQVMEEQGNKQPPAGQIDPWADPSYSDTGAVDLRKEIRGALREEIGILQKGQLEAQQRNNAEWNYVNNDPDYGIVGEVFENQLKDPKVAMQIQTGRVRPSQLYNKTKLDFYKGLAKQSYETINQLKGGANPPPPHVETGASRGESQNLVNEGGGDDSPLRHKQRELLRAVEKGYRPSTDEILDKFDDVIDGAFNQ